MDNGFTEWTAEHKITLTISRYADSRAVATKFGESLLSRLRGGTLKETTGVWKGVQENGVQIEVISDDLQECEIEAKKVADAAIDNGCSVVQWEQQSGANYLCREYRALDSDGNV
jgi:hypothetical protein